MPQAAPKLRFDAQQTMFPAVQIRGRHASPLEDTYHWILRQSWPTFLALVACVFVLINATFAALYALQPASLTNARSHNFEDAFYFSVHTLGTIGYGSVAPATRWANALVVVESLTGMMLTALLTGIAFARFARPTAQVLFARVACIGLRDGVPHLMFRVANWRHNLVIEAQLRVVLVVDTRTAEGELMRTQIDVPLVRDRTQLFMFSWTAMHRIEPGSPFHGSDAWAQLKAQRAEIFLSLWGLDETLGQTIHARYRYLSGDIVQSARFADVVSVEDDGTRVMDYSAFHEVVKTA